jgi:hypothetical protein
LQASRQAVSVAKSNLSTAQKEVAKERDALAGCKDNSNEKTNITERSNGLVKAVCVAEEALLSAESAELNAEDEYRKASDAASVAWSKTQLYWTKGLPSDAEGLLEACSMGIPVRAVMLLRTAHAHDVATLGADSKPRWAPFDVVTSLQKCAQWDDPILQLAVVQVIAGPDGGGFVNRAIYAAVQGDTFSAAQASEAPVVGAHEMCAAMATLEDAIPAYDAWKQACKLYQLRRPQVDLGHYRNLLDSVPTEQQSVAVLLHCLLEQVACAVSVEGITAAGAAAVDGAEVLAAAKLVRVALAAAVEAVPAKYSPSSCEYVAVFDGDTPNMAAHGLLSGLVHTRPKTGPYFCLQDKIAAFGLLASSLKGLLMIRGAM